jgi:hypothetical protein
VVATAAILNRRAEVGDDQRGGATRQMRAEREGERRGSRPTGARSIATRDSGRRRRGAAMPRSRLNRGGGRGLTGGPQPQCWAQRTVPRRRFKRDLNHIQNSKVSNKFKLRLIRKVISPS